MQLKLYGQLSLFIYDKQYYLHNGEEKMFEPVKQRIEEKYLPIPCYTSKIFYESWKKPLKGDIFSNMIL